MIGGSLLVSLNNNQQLIKCQNLINIMVQLKLRLLPIEYFLNNNNIMEQNNSESILSSQSDTPYQVPPDISLHNYNTYLQDHLRQLSHSSSIHHQNVPKNSKLPKIFTVSQTLQDPFILSHIKPDSGSLDQFLVDTQLFHNKGFGFQKKKRSEQTLTEEETEEKKIRKMYKYKSPDQLTKIYTNPKVPELEKTVASKMLIQSMFKKQFGTSLNNFEMENMSTQSSKQKNGQVAINLNNIDEIFRTRGYKQKAKEDGKNSNKMRGQNTDNQIEFRKTISMSNQNKNVSFSDSYKKNQITNSKNSGNFHLAKIASINYNLNMQESHESIESGNSELQRKHVVPMSKYFQSSSHIDELRETPSRPFVSSVCQENQLNRRKQIIQKIKNKYPCFRKLKISRHCDEFQKQMKKYEALFAPDEQQSGRNSGNKNISGGNYQPKENQIVFRIFPLQENQQDDIREDDLMSHVSGKQLPFEQLIYIANTVIKPEVILYIVFKYQLSLLRNLVIKSTQISEQSLIFLIDCLAAFNEGSLRSLTISNIAYPPKNIKNAFKNRQGLAEAIQRLLESPYGQSIRQLSFTNLQLNSKQFCMISLGVIASENIQTLDFRNNSIDEAVCRTIEMILKHCTGLQKIILSGNYLQSFHLKRFLDNVRAKILI